MLKVNATGKYPGAGYFGAGTIEASECCGLYTVAELAAMCGAAGYPYIVIGGEVFMEISSGQLATACAVSPPDVDQMDSADLVNGEAREVLVDYSGAREGEVWVGDNATWGSCVELVEQTVTAWIEGQVNITCVDGTFVDGPYVAYLFVQSACGARNAVGFPVTWPEP